MSRILFLLTCTALTTAWADPYGDAVLKDKPAHYYRFQSGFGSDGARAQDDGSGKSDGQASRSSVLSKDEPKAGPGAAEGLGGFLDGNLAALFAGEDYLEIGDGALAEKFDGAKAVSVELWVRPQGKGTIFNLPRSSDKAPSALALEVMDGGKVRVSGRSGDESLIAGTFMANVSSSGWSHLVAVCDYEGKKISLFVDGGLVERIDAEFKEDKLVSQPGMQASIMAGAYRHKNQPRGFLNGTIDELAIYDRALTDEQVAAHYRAAGGEPKKHVDMRALAQEHKERGMDVPTINVSPLPAYGYDRLDYAMTISIERSPKGRLWACWVGGGDSEKGFFVLAWSDDDGKTWSDPKVVIDPHDKSLPFERRTLVGTLWQDPAGRLWLFFDQALGYFDGRGGTWYTLCENPDAQDPVWSKPERIWHGCVLNKPTVLKDGSWLLPVSLWDRGKIRTPGFTDAFRELDAFRMSNVLISRDQGKTWTRQGGVAFPDPDFDEAQLIERKDGTIWMTARTRHGLWESESKNQGVSWSDPVPSAIQTVNSRHFLQRLQSGRLLLVKHGRSIGEKPPGRSELTAFLSDDEGRTWQGGLVLDERTGISYPDGFQAPDGSLVVSYDRNRATDSEILMARFTEEDVLAGQINGPNSQLKILVSKALGPKTSAH